MANMDEDTPPREALRVVQQAVAQSLLMAVQNAVAYHQALQGLFVAMVGQVAAGGEKPPEGVRQALELLEKQDPLRQIAMLTDLACKLFQHLPSGTVSAADNPRSGAETPYTEPGSVTK